MRNREQILNQLNEINEYLLKGIPDSDISLMLTTLSTLVTYLASSGALVAESGSIYNKRKVKAYQSLAASQSANQDYWSPSQGKEFVGAQCGDDYYVYEFAQRVNSALVHTIDAIRTAISAEKSLLQNIRA